MGQHQVFLATTKEMALRMGRRRDIKPVLLTIQALRASEAGVTFSRQGEELYMADHIPLGYFSGPPLPNEKEEPSKPKRESTFAPEALAGSFALDMERSPELQQQKLKRKGLKKDIQWKKDARKLGRRRRR
jgi:putative RNA 2'-phosphotransferase